MKIKYLVLLFVVIALSICACKSPNLDDQSNGTNENIHNEDEKDTDNDTDNDTVLEEDDELKITSGYAFVAGDDPSTPYYCAYSIDRQIDINQIKDVEITLSFGIEEIALKNALEFDYIGNIDDYYVTIIAVNDKRESIVLKEICGREFFTADYYCKCEHFFSEAGYYQFTKTTFVHNESFNIPISLFKGKCGWIAFQLDVSCKDDSLLQGGDTVELGFEENNFKINISKR